MEFLYIFMDKKGFLSVIVCIEHIAMQAMSKAGGDAVFGQISVCGRAGSKRKNPFMRGIYILSNML